MNVSDGLQDPQACSVPPHHPTQFLKSWEQQPEVPPVVGAKVPRRFVGTGVDGARVGLELVEGCATSIVTKMYIFEENE